MDYFKKCLKCGQYMSPYLQYRLGYSYTLWICSCGYFEDARGTTTVDNKTAYAGGGASNRSLINKTEIQKALWEMEGK